MHIMCKKALKTYLFLTKKTRNVEIKHPVIYNKRVKNHAFFCVNKFRGTKL